MTLINTDGMTFIGPGSEWFWTAVTGIVLAVTFIAIYRQLRVARSATAMEELEVFERELASERMARAELAVLTALRDGEDPAHSNRAETEAEVIGGFWEKIGNLTRRGYFDARLLWDVSGTSVRPWWAALAPYAHRMRAELNNPRYWEHFEWFSGRMAALDANSGHSPIPMDAAWVASNLEHYIRRHRAFLRFEEAARMGIEASTVAEPVMQTAPPAPSA